MPETPAGHRMPAELLLEVAKWMDNRTLSRLSRTCKGFKDEFRDHLRKRAIAYAVPTLNPKYWENEFVDAVRQSHGRSDEISAITRSALARIFSDQVWEGSRSQFEAFLPRQPLYDAIRRSQYDTVERLLRGGGVNVANGQSFWDEPMLHIAVEFGHIEAVRLLLEHGADPNVEDEEQVRALDISPPRCPRAAIYRLLVDAGAIPSSLHMFGMDVLDLKGGACLLLDALESARGTGLPEPQWWAILVSAMHGEYQDFLEGIFDHRPGLLQLSREDSVEQKVTLFDIAVKLARFQIAALVVRKGVPLHDAPADYYFNDGKMRRIHVPYREVWKALFTRAPGELLDALLERPELRDYEFKDAIRERASVMRNLLG
ncbi:hypothetical protein ASPACDRAFT_64016 [Aspergillus aculeatus ATCC 16872]|uniref:F-box domain-containing protein n=1 Tax=Aspergillus aculeatus (strain ATCC 16872 / CBS 172.66 / WB 5094) TaxID=690307 RepID=A0A1L9WIR2_ASPA1|nr:uncharacterized protein ASPACDRAFT_64016 [Aspergillus aculeatus ATCC 16872]OJJ96026.1 hypothetical protein ASPACDRAFT_64016 [Aspergillus aculeatus ATCC 16872]